MLDPDKCSVISLILSLTPPIPALPLWFTDTSLAVDVSDGALIFTEDVSNKSKIILVISLGSPVKGPSASLASNGKVFNFGVKLYPANISLTSFLDALTSIEPLLALATVNEPKKSLPLTVLSLTGTLVSRD